MVVVSGKDHNTSREMCLSVFAEEHGEVIPAILPSVATKMILQGNIPCRGIVPLPDWLPRESFIEELKKPRVRISKRIGGDFRDL